MPTDVGRGDLDDLGMVGLLWQYARLPPSSKSSSGRRRPLRSSRWGRAAVFSGQASLRRVLKIDWECLRAQLAAPWSAGVAGKGLLLRDGSLRTWCLFDDGSPHHTDAQHLLELPTTRLASYLTFEPDGAVTVWLG